MHKVFKQSIDTNIIVTFQIQL